jgi:hypothetical protein
MTRSRRSSMNSMRAFSKISPRGPSITFSL